MADIASIRGELEKHGQSHLLRFYDELSEPQRKALLAQIQGIDFTWLDELIKKYVLSRPAAAKSPDIQPPPIMPARPGNPATEKLYDQARKRGRELIAAGKVAALCVAGGQGTRLGYEGPKGCLEATPVAHKPLFQVFAEQIAAASSRAGAPIAWYVMTSPINDVPTKAFFRQNKYFGLNEKDVFFFVQGTLPAIGEDGKVLLSRKDELVLSPNGHGGCLLALRDSGALADMAKRGVELISYFQVDNPLVRCIDPLFLGLHDLQEAQMSAKALPKRDPMERLGNFCLVDGKVAVIEYSDMPEELARATTEDGRLRFSAGSIAIHVLSRTFVEKLTRNGRCELPLHRANKVVPFVNAAGETVKPDKPNAVKLEMFVFDAMPLAKKAVILETVRSEEFSPIKNASGEDSPATSLHAQVRRWAAWLEAAGVAVPRDAEGQIAAPIEISPLFADGPEQLKKKIDPKIVLAAGKPVYLD